MKARKLMAAAVLAVVASGQAFAQTTTTTASNVSSSSIVNTYRALKEGPLDMSFFVEAANQGGSKEITGYTNTNIVYLGYRFTSTDSLQLENRWVVDAPNGADSDTQFARSVVKYKRSGILNEKDNGINLSAALERRFYPEQEYRQSKNTDGLNRASVSASKSFGDLGLASTFYYATNDVRDQANHSTQRNYLYLVTSQSYDLGRNFSTGFTQEFFKDNNRKDKGETTNIALTLEIGNQLTPDLYVGATVAGSPVLAKDEWIVDSQWAKNLTYAVNMSITAF